MSAKSKLLVCSGLLHAHTGICIRVNKYSLCMARDVKMLLYLLLL
jgi:hypothetical protein